MTHHAAKIIFLIGFMGSGKSHEGKLLAAQLGVSFIDLDEWIEDVEQTSIANLFKEKGEAHFRSVESRELVHAAEHLRSKYSTTGKTDFAGVIATGGGTPCYNNNMDWMNACGLTVWLNLSVYVLVARLVHEKTKRPLIAGLDDQALHQFIEQKLIERKPDYSKATIIIDELVDTTTLIQKIKHAQENV
ncbi:MAG: hypothetical protein RL642_357 [Bacteroidota bacterium]